MRDLWWVRKSTAAADVNHFFHGFGGIFTDPSPLAIAAEKTAANKGAMGLIRSSRSISPSAEELMLQLSDFRLEFLDLPLELGFSPFAVLELGFPIVGFDLAIARVDRFT